MRRRDIDVFVRVVLLIPLRMLYSIRDGKRESVSVNSSMMTLRPSEIVFTCLEID